MAWVSRGVGVPISGVISGSLSLAPPSALCWVLCWEPPALLLSLHVPSSVVISLFLSPVSLCAFPPGLGPPNQSPCDLLGLPPAPTLSYLCPQLAWEGGACRQLPRSHSWGEGQGPCGLLWTEPAPLLEEPQLGTLEASCMPGGTQRVTSLGRRGGDVWKWA